MSVKHFLLNPEINPLSKEDIAQIEQANLKLVNDNWIKREQKSKEQFEQECNLKHTFGRVIVKVNLEAKNVHTFANGTQIRRERQFNEFNRRITQPAQGIAISGEGIPKGSEILIAHNSTHDTNKIFSYKTQSPDIQYFSIPEYDCFAWRNEQGEMQPMPNFEFGLRVYKQYQGRISFITPELVKDTLFITTGQLKGNVVHTLKAADYQIVFQGLDGKEDNLIRIRHSEDPEFDREEVVAISNDLTEKVLCGTLHIGLTPENCKPLNEYYGKNS